MRKIDANTVKASVKKALIRMNHQLDNSLLTAFRKAREKEKSDVSKSILDDLIENQEIAKRGVFPLCQDTGMVVMFVEAGNEIIMDFSLDDILNQSVKEAYKEGFLRKSVVNHPFRRENTRDNTPAVIHYKQVLGDRLKIKVAAKGAGSENMSKVGILKPSDGMEGVKKMVLDAITEAGGKPCPPIIVGIGLGGNLEKSALLAKEALFRDLDDENNDPELKELEKTLYDEINDLDIGPMGVGGATTCLGVKINTFPMHIASLPVAINIQCHAARHEEVIL